MGFVDEIEKNGVVIGRRPSPLPRTGPSEASEQRRLVVALERVGVCYAAVPMGGARGRESGAAARREGARRGFPDLLIFDEPCGPPSPGARRPAKGVAVELKRSVRGSRPTKDQLTWLKRLAARGWIATVQWGCDEALAFLRRWGYPV